MTVRTRFAPSPTGVLHVGSVRTALFAWLYAKNKQGQFVLRIEDTDLERSTKESVEAILEGMAWIGLEADEGPIFQTDRLDRYKEMINQLVEEGKAYYCYCSKERLNDLREQQLKDKLKPKYDGCCRDKGLNDITKPHVIRFKNPQEGTVDFTDAVYGEISVANSELDDLIIQRSDGLPTYNFAVVIDDMDMAISHVIRGDDHINNTPRQINIYQAFAQAVPVFAHLPMILGEDGKRLSKRHGAVGVMQFREMGILPQALLNYLVRLGWSQGDKEIFSLEEMKQEFDLNAVSRSSSAFDYDKLKWLNQHYMRELSPEALANELVWYYERRGIALEKGPKLEALVPHLSERCKTLDEFVDKSLYFFVDEIAYDEKAVKKHFKAKSYEPLKAIAAAFSELSDWDGEKCHQIIVEIAEKFELSMGKVAQPVRIAVTGGSMSPSIDFTLEHIGQKRVLNRLEKAVRYFEENVINT